ncbi:MAG: HNH endonuclease [Flexilinea sp.]|nr:HNH endonuclease [Flexilinea sp.]
MITEDNRQSVLKTYYSKYLTDARGLNQSSVGHYLDALNNISRRLKNKNLVKNDIYEISELDILIKYREILFSDPDFIELDSRGRRMYSSGLNNYIRFASGDEFRTAVMNITEFDTPIAPPVTVSSDQTTWRRSGILRSQILVIANYTCEINKNHETFIAEKTRHPFMESHHIIPMRFQNDFEYSLDVYANLICLCPICHRKIHYGLKQERKDMMKRILSDREERLIHSGISLCSEDIIEMVI